jgi:histidinol-phosphate aminotransferase
VVAVPSVHDRLGVSFDHRGQPSHAASSVASVPSPDLVPIRDDLRALEGYHSAQVEVEVRLNTNESPFPPPPTWREELTGALASIDWHRYPDRAAGGLRAAIAAWHRVPTEQVFAANGSNEVLQTLLLTYAGPGRTVLTFEPTYQLHAHIARITGATVVEVERGPGFTLTPDAVVAAAREHRPAVLFLCSPNNPTGIVEDPAVVDAALDASEGLVVVDEAYAQFSDWSALDLVAEDRPLAVVRTFSKTWSMAAARLGYLVGPSWLVGHLSDVVLPYHLDAAKQTAGTLALGHVDEMDERVKIIVEERERIVEGLDRLAVETFPSGANFVLFRVGGGDVDEGHRVWQALVERSVLVRDCSGWPRLGGCLRVTVGTPHENDRFLAALEEALA